MATARAADRVAAAIKATEAPVQSVQVPVRMSTGRVVVVTVPPDLTDAEAVEWTAWFLGALIPQLRLRKPTSRLVLPGSRSD